MTLLMVVTVIYLPIVLPLLLPGVKVDAGTIALSLLLEMILPLAVGLFVKARYDEHAGELAHLMGRVANISLVLLFVLTLVLNFQNLLNLFGSGGLIITILTAALAFGAGYLLGGPGSDSRRVLALGTAQRNLAAAMVVAVGNFADRPNVLVMIAAAGLLFLAILLPTAAELGKRSVKITTDPASTQTGARTKGGDQTITA